MTLLLTLFAALFMVINIIVVCYITIRLGYGPPNWQTALNLVVRLTTLQNRLNSCREWIDKKAPWMDKLLYRLHVPKPIMIIDTSFDEFEESDEIPEESISEESTDETTEESPGVDDAPAAPGAAPPQAAE